MKNREFETWTDVEREPWPRPTERSVDMERTNMTDAELVAALRCCVKDPGDLDGCKACPLNEHWEDEDGNKCYDRLNLAAAERLEELVR